MAALNSLQRSQLRGRKGDSVTLKKDAADSLNEVVDLAKNHLGFVETLSDHFDNGDKEAVAKLLAAAIPSDIKTLENAVAESKDFNPDLGAESLPDLAGVSVEEVLKHPSALVATIENMVDPNLFQDVAALMRSILSVLEDVQSSLQSKPAGNSERNRQLKRSSDSLFDSWLFDGSGTPAPGPSTDSPTVAPAKYGPDDAAAFRNEHSYRKQFEKQPFAGFSTTKAQFNPRGSIDSMMDNPNIKEMMHTARKDALRQMSQKMFGDNHKHKERRRRRLDATNQCRLECEPDDSPCNCRVLVGCAQEITHYGG